ncbi:unnamed protein product [Linum tenue]|uniref:Homeobox-leucine zipper protein n=1 Tax=Linum tenue TaxID=586396 RepID=A0AAV0N2K6_9ROSI|nr:unnamed protein product [Linum tenue]
MSDLMVKQRESSPEAPDAKSETLACYQPPHQPPKKKKTSSNKSKRRFSDEQIRLLESIFESETKLEPRKKMQVARELGLQPRQVAIWFQNKRARWKSKQIEKDYKMLKANYDSLASSFESLQDERQTLLLQVLQNLNALVEKSWEGDDTCKDMEGSRQVVVASEDRNMFEPQAAQQGVENKVFTSSQSSQFDKSRGFLQPGYDGYQQLVDKVQATEGSLPPGCQFDVSYGSSQWFNFWC